jgi:alanyl-tRNA synthetase
LKLLSAYIQRRAKLSEQEVIETILKSKNQVMATKVRTMFDIVEERGIEKGIEKGIAIGEAKSEDRIKQAEAKIKETEARAEAKVKETEAKAKAEVKETEAKAKETEAKAKETEAKLRAMVKILMLTTPMTDAQFVQQFQLSEDFVAAIRKEMAV